MLSIFHRLTLGTCTAALMAFASPVAAQVQAQTIAFDIPAQDLGAALRAFARQSRQQVIFEGAAARGKTSQALKGAYEVTPGLEVLLRGSGLNARRGERGVLMVAEGSRPQDDAVVPYAEATAVDELMVTGTRLKRSLDNGFPLNSYSRAEVESSGQADLQSFLATRNEVSINARSAGIFTSTGYTSTVQLRGLPLGTTLTLVNGRRVQSSGSATGTLLFDLNSIPFEAVEKIDVVPVGSSAIYGGDALAGVINIVLKRSFDGLALGANYGVADGTNDFGASIAAGRTFSRGSAMVVGSFAETTPLTTLERGFFLDADYRRFGGPDARGLTCTPGTVTSATSANLPGLGATTAGIPSLTSSGKPTIANFQPTAGVPNLCGRYANGVGGVLVAATQRYAIHAVGEYRIAGSLTAFAEATYSHDSMDAPSNAIMLNNLLVPATNAFNPFGVDVRVTAQLGRENGTTGASRASEYMRFLAGLRGDLPHGWDFEVSAMRTQDKADFTTLGFLTGAAARTAALASSNPDLALNPFATGRAASETVLRGIWNDLPQRVGEGQHDQINGFVRGGLPALAAGDMEVVVGAEVSRDIWDTSGINIFYDTDRSASAIFGESNIPLLAGRESQGAPLVALSLAGRVDSFSDYGKAATYQAGLEIAPAPGLHVRLARSTSFKPPSLYQLNSASIPTAIQGFGLRDPRRANEAVTVGTVYAGGPSSSLKAETGEATTFGAVWEPGSAPGLKLGASAWAVDISGYISLLLPQVILAYESSFPELITRAPSVGGQVGRIETITSQYRNFGSVGVSGIDYEAAYSRLTRLGRINLSASATQTRRYEVAPFPGAAIEERVSRRFADFWAPEWKGRATIGLERDAWRVGLTGRYLGGYLDEGESTRALGSRWTYDVTASAGLFDNRAKVTLNVVNLANQMPQFASTASAFYDPSQGDWRGRYVSLRLSSHW
jgi:iron complex outermembrane receptor protein